MSRILLLLVYILWMLPGAPGEGGQAAPPPRGYFADTSTNLSIFASGYMAVVLLLGLWSRALAKRVDHHHHNRRTKRFTVVVNYARWFIPAWFGVGIFALGWAASVDSFLTLVLGPAAKWPMELPGAVIGTLPALLAWAALWWAQYPADHALREENLLTQLNLGLPVHQPPTFRSYFASNLRLQILFTVVPILLIMLIRDVATVAITWQDLRAGRPAVLGNVAELCVLAGSAGGVFVLAPEVLRRVLDTQRLPRGELRTRLETLGESMGLRYRDILLWRTQNNMGNAAVMGVLPGLRYVLLSDLLLETMEDHQIEAVFAHEAGHVKHRHLAWLMLVLAGVSMVLSAAAGPLERWLRTLTTHADWIELGLTAPAVGLFWLAFGYVSRKFERQADVFAARTMERAAQEAQLSQSPPQDVDATVPVVGEAGAKVYASALQRVALVNNIPARSWNWSHGSIASRMKFIRSLSNDPGKTHRFDRMMTAVYAGIVVVVIGGAVWAGVEFGTATAASTTSIDRK